MESKIKIAICGVQSYGIDLIEHLYRNGYSISYIITIDSEKAKKHIVSGYVSYKEISQKYNIPIYYSHKYSLKSPADINFFEENNFDILIQGVWQRLFPDEILRTLKIGAIGIHGSSELLPKGRGRSPINWSLIYGKKRFLLHYFLIKPGIDDGDVFHVESFDINEWDDCRTLYLKNLILTKKVLVDILPKLITNKLKLIPQYGTPTYYSKRTPEDGLINWGLSVFEIYNFIRAITKPYPGAYSFFDSTKVTIWKAQPFDTRIIYHGAKCGEVVEKFDNNDFLINCNSGLLLVTEADKILNVGDCLIS